MQYRLNRTNPDCRYPTGKTGECGCKVDLYRLAPILGRKREKDKLPLGTVRIGLVAPGQGVPASNLQAAPLLSEEEAQNIPLGDLGRKSAGQPPLLAPLQLQLVRQAYRAAPLGGLADPARLQQPGGAPGEGVVL